MKEPRNRHDIDEGKIKSILLSFRRSQSIETFDAMAQHQFRSLLVPTIVGSRPDSTRDPSVQAHATDGADASSLIVHRLPFRLSRTVHQNTGTAADRLIGRQIAGTDQSTDPTSRATDRQVTPTDGQTASHASVSCPTALSYPSYSSCNSSRSYSSCSSSGNSSSCSSSRSCSSHSSSYCHRDYPICKSRPGTFPRMTIAVPRST